MRAEMIVRRLAAVLSCHVILCGSWVSGGEITLKDGTILSGKQPVLLDTVGVRSGRPDPKKSPNLAVFMIEEAGAVQFFVPRLRGTPNYDINTRPAEIFKLPAEKRGRSRHISEVAGQIQETPWDEHGHRMASFKSNGKVVDVMQEIIELNPKYVKVTAMDYSWEFGLPTNSIPAEMLDKMLHHAIKKDNPDERFAIARFYLDGEFYALAQHELETIRVDFPDSAKQVDELSERLKQYIADQALIMLDERREAGQYQFAYDTTRKFLDLKIADIRAGNLLKLKKAVSTADEERAKMEDVRQLLGQLQAQLPKELAAQVAPLRITIGERLHPDTLDRLAPFLNAAQNQKPEEKLALALSGWVLGADLAETDLKQALRLWDARALLIEYFRAENSVERAAVIEEVQKLEGVGPRQVVRLLPLLPPRFESLMPAPSVPFVVDVPRRTEAEPEVQYTALLPPEYHSDRNYPVIVALHAAGMTPELEMRWWARQAQRLGYIVLAPKFAKDKQLSYDYSLEAHLAVTETIRDARRRFSVDSNRIFLGGHGMGADAVFDIGYSHPDLFAGIMPISGMLERSTHDYRENAKYLPQFIIAGQLDRRGVEENAQDLDHMMRYHYPLIYAVFIGRGYESFQSEDVRLFEWMPRQRRAKPPLEIEVSTGRTTDNHFWWWNFSNFSPPKFGTIGWTKEQKGAAIPKPMVLGVSAKRAKGANVIMIDCAAQDHNLWLFPDVVSFEKILTVRLKSKQLYHQIPEPDISAMLEDFRLRADRQQIAWGYLELSSSNKPKPAVDLNRNQGVTAKQR
ncbi:MAG: hypothetical protein V4719_31660 [Planctomycetota bacterium]